MSDSNENQTSSYMAAALSSGARSRFRCSDRVCQAPAVRGISVFDVSDHPAPNGPDGARRPRWHQELPCRQRTGIRVTTETPL